MTDEERIAFEMENAIWTHLGVLADLAEDAGDEILLCGYKWLIKHNRRPKRLCPYNSNRAHYSWTLAKNGLKHLYLDILPRVETPPPKSDYEDLATEFEAYKWAAQYVGSLIQEGLA